MHDGKVLFNPGLLVALTIFCTQASAEVTVSIETGAGYKTNVPCPGDSLFKNRPFASAAVAPEYSFIVSHDWKALISGDAEYTNYFGDLHEWDIDPSFFCTRDRLAPADWE